MSYSEALLEGLAPDGGLAVPAEIPQVDAATLERWRALSYAELATEVLGLFATDIPRDALAGMTARAYAGFPRPVVPSTPTSPSSGCPRGRHSRSRTWPCNSSARCSSTRSNVSAPS